MDMWCVLVYLLLRTVLLTTWPTRYVTYVLISDTRFRRIKGLARIHHHLLSITLGIVSAALTSWAVAFKKPKDHPRPICVCDAGCPVTPLSSVVLYFVPSQSLVSSLK